MAGQLAEDASPKARLRRAVLAARDAVTNEARAAAGAKITQQLLALDAWQALLAAACASGKTLCLPRVDRDRRELAIHRVNDMTADVQAGVWGIREPRAACPPAALDAIDFVLVPGVAFTPRCERLGYGGGFYDRLIARFAQRPPLVAAAFGVQMRDEIPLSERDRSIDLVITENAAYCGC